MSSPFDSTGHLPKDAGIRTPPDDSVRSGQRPPAVKTLQLAGTPLPERRNPSKRAAGDSARQTHPANRTNDQAEAPHRADRMPKPQSMDRTAESRNANRVRASRARRRTPRRDSRPWSRAPKPSIPQIIVIIAAAVLIALAFCHMVGFDPFATFDDAASSDTSSSSTGVAQMSASEVASALKGAGIDNAVAEQAGKLSENDSRFVQIAENIDAYRKDGAAVQRKLVKLAVDDPEAIGFVTKWPDSYPQKAGTAYDGTVEKGQIPQLYQWDERWGYTTYSSTSFALTGCCPTSLSMVYMGLTGKTDMTPYDMGVLAGKDGYESKHEGTIGDFLTDDAAKLGLTCRKIDLDSDSLKYYLHRGYVIICNVGAGDFTDGGHYFVITGLDDQGKLTIHDPYSSVRSAKHWNIARVLNQTIALYAFTTPD